jgi:dolichyl-phosphate beta-glucosyltransferase
MDGPEPAAHAGIRLSVVIPAFNEEQRLPHTLSSVLEYLNRQAYVWEVIVVDDGSTDGTARVAEAQSSRGMPVRLVCHPDRTNHGKGAAVRAGMLAARGSFRVFMDADNSTTLDHVERFWPAFEEGFDVVIGSRNIQGSDVAVHQAAYKEFAGRLGNCFIRALAVPGIKDTQAGFKMFTARAAVELFRRQTIDRWGYDVELLAVARLLGFRVKELPIRWVNAPGSKVRWNTYVEVLLEVWRIRRNLKAGRYSGLPAVDTPPSK